MTEYLPNSMERAPMPPGMAEKARERAEAAELVFDALTKFKGTQRDFAKLMGVEEQVISRWKNGRIASDDLQLVREYLDGGYRDSSGN